VQRSIEIGVNWIWRGGDAENGVMRWKYGLGLCSEREKKTGICEGDAKSYEAYSHFTNNPDISFSPIWKFAEISKEFWRVILLTEYN
jgi:hypothetical protein